MYGSLRCPKKYIKKINEPNVYISVTYIYFSFVHSCLNDEELDFLGAPWPKYHELATKNSIDVIRLPMIEGSCPDTVEEIDPVVDEVTRRIKAGQNVLAHCRGGESFCKNSLWGEFGNGMYAI